MKRHLDATFIQKFVTGSVALFVVFSLATKTTQAYAPEHTQDSVSPNEQATVEDLQEKVGQLKQEKEEILMFARCIRSETERPSEMPTIAWVIRNRVDTKFRGTTYSEVCTAKGQFTGMIPGNRDYKKNMARTYTSHPHDTTWIAALDAAREVFYAESSERPFPKEVRHFYSPQVVKAPMWAEGRIAYMAHGERFHFYLGVE